MFTVKSLAEHCGPFLILFTLLLQVSALHAAELELDLPADVRTVDDGRAAMQELYASYNELLSKGWILDIVAQSQPEGTRRAMPIVALRTRTAGPAIWIISGIHGEEPAGPNAVANVIDELAGLGGRHPVVLIPVANPHGYLRNWRYLNSPVWSDAVDAQSVGDSSHLLPDAGDPRQARAARASSAEADAVSHYVLDKTASYPPRISIDLHEDDKISEAYVYSQGVEGAADRLAREAVAVLYENAIPVKAEGLTRFGEEIVGGIIGPVEDGSIDELMSAKRVIVGGTPRAGPGAHTVLVFETPAGTLPLERRIAAHEALLKRMIRLLSEAEN